MLDSSPGRNPRWIPIVLHLAVCFFSCLSKAGRFLSVSLDINSGLLLAPKVCEGRIIKIMVLIVRSVSQVTPLQHN